MSNLINQDYLRDDQYRDASNFTLRLRAMQKMGVMRREWYRWIFDHIQLAPRGRVLELGCGPGFLWQENLDRVPSTWKITLSDFSPGMLRDARELLSASDGRFLFEVIDAQAIPYPDAHFDAVIANAMLYHVPNLSRALSEIRRVLKPGGHFYATTVGDAAVSSLDKLMGQVHFHTWLSAPFNFSIDNGREQIERWFKHVQLERLEERLIVRDPDALMDLARSGMSKADQQDPARLQALRHAITHLLTQQPTPHIDMDFGIFIAG